MEKITSTKNKKYKYWQSLLDGRGLKKSEHYLLSGPSFVAEKLQQDPSDIDCILLPKDDSKTSAPIKHFLLNRDLFSGIDLFGTDSPILVLKKPQIPEWDFKNMEGLTLILPMGEPSNMGATLRNAAAFGVINIILLKEACSPFHPKSVRAAAGNLETLSFYQGPSIHDLQVNKDFICLHMEGEELETSALPKNMHLLVGEEGPGLPETLRNSAKKIKIPMANSVESLNAAFSASLILYKHFVLHKTD